MQHCTFELDEESKELCTVAAPFGLCHCAHLPVGVNQAPDIVQEGMEKSLKGIEDLEVYIDDSGHFSVKWDQHMSALDQVCWRLEEKGFTVNPLKCKFGVKELDFLGHWLMLNGVKPLQKKVQGMLDMQPPENLTQLRSFLGLVTCCRDMGPRRFQVLTPLTDLLGTKVFKWEAAQQMAFLQMKAIMAKDTLLTPVDHNKPFKRETNASDCQLGGRIFQMHHDKVLKEDVELDVAFCTRKLNSAQTNCTTKSL
jgi:hypothetical protein